MTLAEDPWLPARMSARIDAETVEASVRQSVWAALSGWLVRTARRVLAGGGVPTPDAVWARVPAWREAVDLVVDGAIRDAMGVAYRRVLGDEYPWDQRPLVSAYLAEVRNRMVRTPDEVFELVAGEIATGVNLGDSIPELRDRVDEILSTTRTERWPNRATVVARTETIGALNAGRDDAFGIVSDDFDVPMEKIWLSTSDSRTRPSHREADGQRIPLGSTFVVGGFPLRFPGDPTGPPQEVIQCRCTHLLVEAGENVDMTNRQYRGQ